MTKQINDQEKLTVWEWNDGTFSLYNEAGQAIEHDFASQEEAEKYATENGYMLNDEIL